MIFVFKALTAFISLFHAVRQMVREMMIDGEFIEVFVDTPPEVCEARGIKYLYKKRVQVLLKTSQGLIARTKFQKMKKLLSTRLITRPMKRRKLLLRS